MGRKCDSGCTCGKHVLSQGHREKLRQKALSGDHSYKVGLKQSVETVAKRVEKNRLAFLRRAGSSYISNQGYRVLTGQVHPLAASGEVAEHRKVLYDAIGPGPHECHWNSDFGCGQTALSWGGMQGIVADHLDDDQLNNDPSNLVPSCLKCNWDRSNPAMIKHRKSIGVGNV